MGAVLSKFTKDICGTSFLHYILLSTPWIPPYQSSLLTQEVQSKVHIASMATMKSCMFHYSSISPRHTLYRISTALGCSVSAYHLTDGPSRELQYFEQVSRMKSKWEENDKVFFSFQEY